jgi:hypothetical protein
MANDALPTANEEPTGMAWWALGFLFFACPVIVMVGLIQCFQGLAAIINGGFYVVPPNYAYKLDPAVWGWIYLLLGILVTVTGIFLWSGKPWARTMAIILALLSAVANFFTIPYYPIWSIVIIALNVVIIWAIVAHGREMAEMMA